MPWSIQGEGVLTQMVSKSSSLKRVFPAFGLALIAALLLSGLVAGSASATTQRWFACQNVGSGTYSDSACQTPGIGNFDWVELPEKPTEFSASGSTPFTLSATLALTKGTITCTAMSAYGVISNPAAGAAGDLSTTLNNLVMNGCTVKAGSGECQLKEGGFYFKAVKGEATEFGGKQALKLVPAEGGTFASSKFEKCVKLAAYEGLTVSITGTMYAYMNAATSSLEFTEATSASTKMNGAKAVVLGTAKIETTSGNKLKFGTSAAPVNTSPPAVSPAHPHVGELMSASTGSWLNGPTSYSYQWDRCSSTGTGCQEIPGATKSTYVPVTYDEARTVLVHVTATNGGGSATATSAPSGIVDTSATGIHHWYSCQKVEPTKGAFEDSACTKDAETLEGATYEWVELTPGSATSFTSKNTTPIKLSFEASKVLAKIECSTEAGSGTVLNPSGGGAGTFVGAGSLLTFTGCKFTSGLGCTVENEKITGGELSGATNGQKVALSSGIPLMTFRVPSCYWTGNYSIGGTLNGIFNSPSSSLVFDSTSGSELKNLGAKTWLEGSIQLSTASGLLRFR